MSRRVQGALRGLRSEPEPREMPLQRLRRSPVGGAAKAARLAARLIGRHQRRLKWQFQNERPRKLARTREEAIDADANLKSIFQFYSIPYESVKGDLEGLETMFNEVNKLLVFLSRLKIMKLSFPIS